MNEARLTQENTVLSLGCYTIRRHIKRRDKRLKMKEVAMGFFSNFKKNRAIKSYINKLPTLLLKNYGKSQKYTPEQIRETIENHGLNLIHLGYAMAMFSNRDAFNAYVHKYNLKWKYNHFKKEVADRYFCGRTNFEIRVTKAALYKGNADDDLKGHYFRKH